jgi:3-hydroxyisobutyrate dehydrogenase
VRIVVDRESPAARVAVIGLGSMGYGIASSLERAGFDIAVYDVRADTVARFVAEHADRPRPAKAPAEAVAGVGVIFIVVVNADQTAEVLSGSGGVLEGAAPGAVVISCATMAPERVRSLACDVTARGLLFLDAPISGGAQKAQEGGLTVLASGAPAAFAAAGPTLNAIAAKLYRLGDEPGIGASFKIINQLLAGVHIAAACEAIALACRLGLDLAKVYEVITASAGNSWMFTNRVPHILEGDYTPRSAVSIFTKDLGIVADVARSESFPAPVAATALQMFLMTAAAGMAHDDDSSVARLFAKIARLELPERKV